MQYGTVSFDKRIKDNIRDYSLSALLDISFVKEYLKNMAVLLQLELLLTDRHGEKILLFGKEFEEYIPDVVNSPGLKIRVMNRTVAHLYYMERGREDELVVKQIEDTVKLLSKLGEETYYRKEEALYREELEKKLSEKKKVTTLNEHDDPLTGVFHKMYFENRCQVLDRSEIIPVAVMEVNINDWKYTNDHFGDEESDRLISMVANILKEEAEPYFVLGRIDGDVFGVLIPMAEDEEAANFARRVKERCLLVEDEHLTPSVAIGTVMKMNIEEKIESLLSDAEYLMLEDKMEMKANPDYQTRLRSKA